MRDHRLLKAFTLADALVLVIYQSTRNFPREEQFGLVIQMRRAAVSIPSNLVEGCARESEAEFLRFVNIAVSSAKELGYQISLAHRLGFLKPQEGKKLAGQCEEVIRVGTGLWRSLARGKSSRGRSF